MRVPASPHFTTIPLHKVYTVERSLLLAPLRAPSDIATAFGQQSLLGIPFDMGESGRPNVILLDQEPVTVSFSPRRATYILFAHVVADRITNYQTGLADFAVDGNELGNHVADYTLVYAANEGTAEANDQTNDHPSQVTVPIVRRFAIQQARIGWGASPAAAQPHVAPGVFLSTTEEQILGRVPEQPYGRGETRHSSPRDRVPEKIWLYALPNPYPDRPIESITLTPGSEAAAVYAITTTELSEHPLRPALRHKLRLKLPNGVQLNALGELEGLAIDLGSVISARAVLRYDPATWQPDRAVVQPAPAQDEVIVEYAAHPAAKLYVPTLGDPLVYDLADVQRHSAAPSDVVAVTPALRPVKLRVHSRTTGRPVPVRLHLHGEAGEYLPPRGHHRKVNGYWFEDNYGEFVNAHNQYAYIDGECEVDLPLGTVYVEITRGYETAPIRESFQVTADTDTVTFDLDKVLQWREKGWVTADTHVHFLSPQTALLEGQAEGVHVVNLLASQWGEMFSNVTDFDGKTTLGARDFGGDGEFLVRVGTENRMQVLGHISLLGYRGEMIHPLCSGGPSEAAIGDPLEVTMAEWAKRCIDQGGLTVMPHAPNPQLERAADIVLGLVNAIEMMTFNPLNPALGQINPYGVADWYRYLNLGYQVPVVGGSDKMAASSLLGGIRTYAHLGGREFTYEDWMEAVRAGNTFVTVGPLATLEVDGNVPGSRIQLGSDGGTVHVSWRVESVSLPITQVEVVVGGLVADATTPTNPHEASGQTSVRVTDSTWVALRVRGSYRNQPEEIAAHTSAVQLAVEGKPLFNQADAGVVLDQIQGAIAYVDTLAPRPAAQRLKQLRATLESAYNQLHQRMHRAGHFHRHTPVHDHAHPHEH